MRFDIKSKQYSLNLTENLFPYNQNHKDIDMINIEVSMYKKEWILIDQDDNVH